VPMSCSASRARGGVGPGVRGMATGAIVVAMANPTPEVQPEEVRDGVAIVATERSDSPNQINNVLGLPGPSSGALDVRARTINEEMKLAAAHAIARVIPESELLRDYIIPSVFNRRVADSVAEAVANAAVASSAAPRAPFEPATPLEAMGRARSDPAVRCSAPCEICASGGVFAAGGPATRPRSSPSTRDARDAAREPGTGRPRSPRSRRR
jgi:malic enzyme